MLKLNSKLKKKIKNHNLEANELFVSSPSLPQYYKYFRVNLEHYSLSYKHMRHITGITRNFHWLQHVPNQHNFADNKQ